MDLVDKISAELVKTLPDEELAKLNLLLDEEDVSEQEIRTLLDESGVDIAKIIKKVAQTE